MIKKVLRAYNEPYLNLHFLGPYLKNNSASLSAYELIFQLIAALPVKWRTLVLQDIQKEIKDCKKHVQDVQNGGQESSAYLDKLLPLYHIVIHMITNFLFSEEVKECYKELQLVSQELRLNPLPYGILPHEIVEIIDNEKILPRITYLFKASEDFPYLNHFDISIKDDTFSDEFQQQVQRHQRVLLLGPQTDAKDDKKCKTLVDVIGLYKQERTPLDLAITFGDMNMIRYTYIKNLFEYYGVMAEDLREKCFHLQSHYIWNIYRQLSSDMLDKVQDLRYTDIEQNFKQQVIEKLKMQIKDKIVTD